MSSGIVMNGPIPIMFVMFSAVACSRPKRRGVTRGEAAEAVGVSQRGGGGPPRRVGADRGGGGAPPPGGGKKRGGVWPQEKRKKRNGMKGAGHNGEQTPPADTGRAHLS